MLVELQKMLLSQKLEQAFNFLLLPPKISTQASKLLVLKLKLALSA